MIIAGIDPGPTNSGYARLVFPNMASPSEHPWPIVIGFGHYNNNELREEIVNKSTVIDALVIEGFEKYGEVVGNTVFDSIFWQGRFFECSERFRIDTKIITQGSVRLHLCGTKRVTKAHVNAAVRDKFEPGYGKYGKGTRAKPGPLYGVSGQHVMDAIAVTITLHEMIILHEMRLK